MSWFLRQNWKGIVQYELVYSEKSRDSELQVSNSKKAIKVFQQRKSCVP